MVNVLAQVQGFDAFVAEQSGNSSASVIMKSLNLEDLPDYDVLVEIEYSSVNYKDGLFFSKPTTIARNFPTVGGIDLAGTVMESNSPEWHPGDKVIVNGWGMSETQWGGFSRYQRVRPEWLIPLPDAFSSEEAMAIGTAGYTAALCVDALERAGVLGGPSIVTGAAGGVGSFAVLLMTKAGCEVTAVTGRSASHDYLSSLGATGFVGRAELTEPGRPFQKERWQGGIDSVGGPILANLLAQARWGAAFAACGLAGSADLPASVLPFILRNVSLLGVDSVMAPRDSRMSAWARLARDVDRGRLTTMYEVRSFSALPAAAKEILEGKIQGRVVIKVAK